MTDNSITRGSSFWISVALIGVGMLILLDNFNLFDFGDIWSYWPAILIVVGVAKLVGSNYKDVFSSGILIAIGSIFLFDELNIFYIDDILELWPLILIFIGSRIIWNLYYNDGDPSLRAEGVSEDRVDGVAIFGGREMRVDSPEFKGGNLTVLFGGSEIYLGNSTPAAPKAVLDVFVMFGGAEIYVPTNWRVVQKAIPLFGGFTDSRRAIDSSMDPTENVLVINGFVMFGGVEVKAAG